ncbi:MAG: Uma2 family endonuclease, partial [Chloracidobacterium sp.]|nr:Uma2 family endonuclease [Chloracidobacterium sp.]
RAPLIIVEALSPQTRRNDLAEYGRGAWSEDRKLLRKWDIYESVLKVPYYVTIDERREVVRWFRHDGARYVEERPAGERLWVGEAGLFVGAWRGWYERRHGLWVRFYDGQGALIPTKAEREALEREAKERERQAKEAALQAVEQERAAKEQERAAKEAALQELERLKAKLRDLNRAD